MEVVMADEPKHQIPPGYYTQDTLPPLSPEAQAILDAIYAAVQAKRHSPEEKALRVRAEEAKEAGGLGDFTGVMLGAEGY